MRLRLVGFNFGRKDFGYGLGEVETSKVKFFSSSDHRRRWLSASTYDGPTTEAHLSPKTDRLTFERKEKRSFGFFKTKLKMNFFNKMIVIYAYKTMSFCA